MKARALVLLGLLVYLLCVSFVVMGMQPVGQWCDCDGDGVPETYTESWNGCLDACFPGLVGGTSSSPLDSSLPFPFDLPTDSSPSLPPFPETVLPPTEPDPLGDSSSSVLTFGDYSLRTTSVLKCASADARPYTSILISSDDKNWLVLGNVLIDSGADRSFFPAEVAESLGIDLSQCQYGTSSGVGGSTITYYANVYIAIVHFGGIEADIDGYIMAKGGKPLVIKTLAGFSEDPDNAAIYLLGREDVFDQLSLTFEGDTAVIRPRSH